MNEIEALEYVDLIVEKLHDWGIIPEREYGNMTEDQRHELARSVAEGIKE